MGFDDGQPKAWLILSLCGALTLAIVILVGTAAEGPVMRLAGRVAAEMRANHDRANRRVDRASLPPSPPPPSYDAAEWITPDDYPPAAIRAGEEGAVRIRWTVGANGRATRCDVVASSGHSSLDAAACRAILRSARYPPTSDLADRVHTRRVVWLLPNGR